MKGPKRIGRRSLLKRSAATVAAASSLSGTLGMPRRAAAQMQDGSRRSTNGRLRVGVIGTGNLGHRHHLNILLKAANIKNRVDVVAVCDVDLNRANDAAADCLRVAGRRVDVYQDYRRITDRQDIDACWVVTPDHWHTLPSLAAIESGKDVYCEKPLTLTIEEGKALVAAVRRYGAVFQTGSQQRSDGTFRQACELVRSGAIGKVKRVDTVLHGVGNTNWMPPQTPPDHLDWEMWLGPAPYNEYRPNCVHYQFRWQYDYSGGVMTDWGAHHNDICQWGLGTDETGPVFVDGTRATWHEHGPYSVPANFDVHYKYADGTELWCHTDQQKYDDGTEFGNGIKFTGTDGWIFVCRGGRLEASFPNPKDVETKVKLYDSPSHHDNFLDCVESRKRCICDVEIGHRSVSICHMGNISMRLGRPLKWDPDKEEFVGDEQANRMVGKPMRSPWHL